MIHEFRNALFAIVPLTNDAIHIYIGMLCLLSTCLLLRRPLSWWLAQLPGFVVSVLIEAFDLMHGSQWCWSLKDIVNINLWPVILVLLANRLGIRARWHAFAPESCLPRSP
jgi:hypothetical protein